MNVVSISKNALLCCAVVLGTISAAHAEDIVGCSSPGMAIPDNNETGIADFIEFLGESVFIDDINLYLEIKHTYIGDLNVVLQGSAAGEPYFMTVLDRPGVPSIGVSGCPSNDIRNTFDDEATMVGETDCATGIDDVAFPPGAYLVPFEPMADNLNDTVSNGFYLYVKDLAHNDTGTLVKWCVIVNHHFDDGFETGGTTAWSQTVPPS